MGTFADAVAASVAARNAVTDEPNELLQLCIRKATKMTQAVRFGNFLAVNSSTAKFRHKQATVRVDTPKLLGQWRIVYVIGDPGLALEGPYTTKKADGSEFWPLVAVDMATQTNPQTDPPTLNAVIRPVLELADLAGIVDPTS